MRYTIKENRLIEIFKSYMDSGYNLSHDKNDSEESGGIHYDYIMDGNEVFGAIVYNKFYYSFRYNEDSFSGMFGEHSNELLIEYLREKFPSLNIKGLG